MPKLHHVAVRARDFERSVKFYEEGIGLGPAYLWNHPPLVPRAAFLPFDDGTWFEIFDGGQPVDPPAPDDMSQGMVHIAIACDDVQAAFERAVTAGAVALEPPVTRTLRGDPPKEATMCFLLGPDGEVLELYRNDDL
jgi:glyoxylase I family protein